MKFAGRKYYKLTTGFSQKDTVVTLGVLLAGLIITAISVFYIRSNIQKAAIQDFDYSCNELRLKVESRLDEHAQLLRSGQGLFSVVDSVTMEIWHQFYVTTNIDKFLPGIEGFGYSKIIHPRQLQEHEKFIRSLGFPQYEITPPGKREIYTSIIFLEPFTGRNLRAFGYDMYSEPIRRKAMEIARDSGIAMLSGKVILVQEIPGEDLQSGVLMYLPVYRNGMPSETVEERRAAIKGWVYSPYRMKDLMSGIQGNRDFSLGNPVRVQIYDDDKITNEALLYDNFTSEMQENMDNPNLSLQLPILFNGKKWTLHFTGRKDEMSVMHKRQLVVWITGIVISFLLFVLSMMQINASIRTRQIAQLNTQLEKLNDDKSRFIAILSHDLKSPFTSILGFLELLASDIRKFSIDQIESHILTIYDAARNTYNLLEDLLMWIRAHSGTIPFNPRLIPFNEIYENVLEIMKPVAEAKKITIDYYGAEKVVVYADQDMLRAIMRNLFSNAIKFTLKGGAIKISAEKKAGEVMISVADTGTGMIRDQLDNLFDISKIMSTAGTGGEKGSGLGLVLCREFVERHEGRIWAESEFGKGSKVIFTLPVKS